MFKTLLFYVTVCAVCQLAFSYKKGAPASVCQHMTPQHGVPAQPFPSPYTLSLNKKEIKAGEKLTLTISSPQEKIKGFLIKAVEETTNATFGSFEAVAGAKLVDCKPGQRNAITHADNSERPTVTVTWVAPRNSGKRRMIFRATIVKNGGEFWVGQNSEPFIVG